MRTYFLLPFCLLLACGLTAQADRNPFELADRLPRATSAGAATDDGVGTGNPFDIQPGRAEATPRGAEAARRSAPLVIQSSDPDERRGSILAIHLTLLLLLAMLWVLFRGLLRQCVASTINDSLMTELYRHRSGGQLGALWMCYLFFFLAAGFFVYLFAVHHDVSLRLGVWASFGVASLLVAGSVGLKHLVLGAYARLFPVRREVGRYAFVLMVFSILAGLVLVPVNLLVSYAPPAWRPTFLYGGLGLLTLLYVLHLLRGLFIANRFLGQRPLHILLYICTIEIAPLLLIYRYLRNTLI